VFCSFCVVFMTLCSEPNANAHLLGKCEPEAGRHKSVRMKIPENTVLLRVIALCAAAMLVLQLFVICFVAVKVQHYQILRPSVLNGITGNVAVFAANAAIVSQIAIPVVSDLQLLSNAVVAATFPFANNATEINATAHVARTMGTTDGSRRLHSVANTTQVHSFLTLATQALQAVSTLQQLNPQLINHALLQVANTNFTTVLVPVGQLTHVLGELAPVLKAANFTVWANEFNSLVNVASKVPLSQLSAFLGAVLGSHTLKQVFSWFESNVLSASSTATLVETTAASWNTKLGLTRRVTRMIESFPFCSVPGSVSLSRGGQNSTSWTCVCAAGWSGQTCGVPAVVIPPPLLLPPTPPPLPSPPPSPPRPPPPSPGSYPASPVASLSVSGSASGKNLLALIALLGLVPLSVFAAWLFKRRKAATVARDVTYSFESGDTAAFERRDEEAAPSKTTVGVSETKTRGFLLGRMFQRHQNATVQTPDAGSPDILPSAPPYAAMLETDHKAPKRRASCFRPTTGGSSTASDPAAPGETRSGIQIASAAVAGVNKDLDTLLVKLGERVVAADKNESGREVINPLLAGAPARVVPPHLMPVDAGDDEGYFSSAE